MKAARKTTAAIRVPILGMAHYQLRSASETSESRFDLIDHARKINPPSISARNSSREVSCRAAEMVRIRSMK